MTEEDYKNVEQDNEDIDVDKILYWKENPDVFLEEVCGLKLYPYQKILLRGLDNGKGGKVYELPLYRRLRW